MIHGAHRSATDLGALEPGTHLCALQRSALQLDRVATTFVGHGLAAGDQLVYVASDEQAEALVEALPEHVDVPTALATGQLRIASFADTYGAERPDDLEAVADGFRAAAAQARKDGFAHLRVAARMDDLVGLLGSAADVVSWERMSTVLQREIQVSSVCLYDSSVLDPRQAAAIAREHDGQAPEVDVPPIGTFLAVDEPWGLRVSGEVDVSNRDLLQRMVVSRAAVRPRVRIDLGGVTFADAGLLTRLHTVASELPGDGWLAIDRVPPVVRRVVEVTGISHERLRIEP